MEEWNINIEKFKGHPISKLNIMNLVHYINNYFSSKNCFYMNNNSENLKFLMNSNYEDLKILEVLKIFLNIKEDSPTFFKCKKRLMDFITKKELLKIDINFYFLFLWNCILGSVNKYSIMNIFIYYNEFFKSFIEKYETLGQRKKLLCKLSPFLKFKMIIINVHEKINYENSSYDDLLELAKTQLSNENENNNDKKKEKYNRILENIKRFSIFHNIDNNNDNDKEKLIIKIKLSSIGLEFIHTCILDCKRDDCNYFELIKDGNIIINFEIFKLIFSISFFKKFEITMNDFNHTYKISEGFFFFDGYTFVSPNTHPESNKFKLMENILNDTKIFSNFLNKFRLINSFKYFDNNNYVKVNLKRKFKILHKNTTRDCFNFSSIFIDRDMNSLCDTDVNIVYKKSKKKRFKYNENTCKYTDITTNNIKRDFFSTISRRNASFYSIFVDEQICINQKKNEILLLIEIFKNSEPEPPLNYILDFISRQKLLENSNNNHNNNNNNNNNNNKNNYQDQIVTLNQQIQIIEQSAEPNEELITELENEIVILQQDQLNNNNKIDHQIDFYAYTDLDTFMKEYGCIAFPPCIVNLIKKNEGNNHFRNKERTIVSDFITHVYPIEEEGGHIWDLIHKNTNKYNSNKFKASSDYKIINYRYNNRNNSSHYISCKSFKESNYCLFGYDTDDIYDEIEDIEDIGSTKETRKCSALLLQLSGRKTTLYRPDHYTNTIHKYVDFKTSGWDY